MLFTGRAQASLHPALGFLLGVGVGAMPWWSSWGEVFECVVGSCPGRSVSHLCDSMLSAVGLS